MAKTRKTSMEIRIRNSAAEAQAEDLQVTATDHLAMAMDHLAMATDHLATAMDLLAMAMDLPAMAMDHLAMAMDLLAAAHKALVTGTSTDQDLSRLQITRTRAGWATSSTMCLGLAMQGVPTPATTVSPEETQVVTEEETKAVTHLQHRPMHLIHLRIKAGMCHLHLLIQAKLVTLGDRQAAVEEELEFHLLQLMAAVGAMVEEATAAEAMAGQAHRLHISHQHLTEATDESI